MKNYTVNSVNSVNSANLQNSCSQNSPVHRYTGHSTLTGRVVGEIRRFARPGGSHQFVFSVAETTPGCARPSRYVSMELYAPLGTNLEQVSQLLSSRQLLKINYWHRYDEYIDRQDKPASRHFLFIDGPSCIQKQDGQAIPA